MASIDDLKRTIDLHDLASRLGLRLGPGQDPGKGKALYHSPHHKDKSPSLSIFVDDREHGTGWKDWSSGEGGSCIDLVCYYHGCGVSEAMRILHEMFSIPYSTPDKADEPRQPATLAESIAKRSLMDKDQVKDYLMSRGISEAAIGTALRANTLGFNTWTSPKVKPGEQGHGGPAAAFISYYPGTKRVAGVDLRYVDPVLNGGYKTQSQGDKDGIGWTADPRKLERAQNVAIVESAINALSVDTADKPTWAAFALRGLNNAELIDWTFLRGKQVIICMDNDEPFPAEHRLAGQRPGPNTAWKLYEILTALNISALIVDQAKWMKGKEFDGDVINDANDYLQEHGAVQLAKALDTLETWLIPGLAGDDTRKGKPRVYLPAHDFAQYYRYRVKPDFSTFIQNMDEKGDDGEKTPTYTDLCGFRVASFSRVAVASPTSTMTGDPDHSPNVYFAVTVQTPRHRAQLVREVMADKQVHNLAQWGQFGPIFEPKRFSRMLTILERTAHLGARNAANFVGLAWLDGRLAVNEGPDCYFTDPEKQCPYYNLTFPSGPQQDAATVIRAYQSTFHRNAATIPLVWALGGHLKALLGFWPHITVQADKGAGKSTLIKRLERTLGFTMFSGQSLETEFRLLTSISHTSHPVGWEELSARRQDVIDKAVGLLQESYNYTVTKRGTAMTPFLLSAPVMLAGEDTPVRSLLGKIVRTDLTGKRGPLMPVDLPRFPVRQWLQYLAELDRKDVLAKHQALFDYCLRNSRASASDDGAKRMAGNYAAVLLAWRYLADFAGMDNMEGDFGKDLVAEMNAHMTESDSDRSPWVWIMETVLSEIDAGRFKHPYQIGKHENVECLMIRTSHIIDHLATSLHLRDKWNGMPVKSAIVFKKQLKAAGIMHGDKECERTILNMRVPNMAPLKLEALARYGLHVAVTLRNGASAE
ncbi:toprim domain-containing protein [Massilia sp. YIM B02763]|uniref:toprim domain-containing protein n=1 Tax=Massilia sp. YIM B02763 TaxID=3050130 RepID=UPI0025B69B38|nr:toprim domain-containing protein [Massilia sp. YIM B02763]MDN4056365.1 toprim domain-containing protein [Massilia sp. YIM B02763]